MTKPAPDESEARAFALSLLGRREYSQRELEQRLLRKWPEFDASGLVDVLAQENLVSDQRYAESFVRSRVQRNQGPRKIRAELRGRGVDDSIIEASLGPLEEEWVSLAAAWLGHQAADELDYEGRARFYRRLLNRGFTHDQAMSALNAH